MADLWWGVMGFGGGIVVEQRGGLGAETLGGGGGLSESTKRSGRQRW